MSSVTESRPPEPDAPIWSKLEIWLIRYCAAHGRTLDEAARCLDRDEATVKQKADALGLGLADRRVALPGALERHDDPS